jgi:hypothetical protein
VEAKSFGQPNFNLKLAMAVYGDTGGAEIPG